MVKEILKETHALKSDLNGILLLMGPRLGLIDHPDENVRKKIEMMKSAMGCIIARIKRIEEQVNPDKAEDFETYFEKFGIERPKNLT